MYTTQAIRVQVMKIVKYYALWMQTVLDIQNIGKPLLTVMTMTTLTMMTLHNIMKCLLLTAIH